MNAISKAAPADIVQATILIDSSGSMGPLAVQTREAIRSVIEQFKAQAGCTLAVRVFAETMQTISEFGVEPLDFVYQPYGGTALYGAVAAAIQKSRHEAALTPEIRTHHVVAVITDGQDTTVYEQREAALDAAQREIENIDVDATFIVMDFSEMGDATEALGLKGIKISDDPHSFKNAMAEVRKAIAQIAENVIRQLPPKTGLCLPPAR